MPDFELFTHKWSRPQSAEETVTISTRGILTFSRLAHECLGSPEAVVFLVSRDDRLIGFRAAAKGEPDSSGIRAPGYSASACSLLRYMDVDYSVSRRYPVLRDDGTPHIDLKQPGTPVTSNRRKH